MPKKKTELLRPMWKQGDGWVQWNPPIHHPCYKEWMKAKEDKKSS